MFRPFGISRALIVGTLLSTFSCPNGCVWAQSAWPEVAVPNEARLFPIGEKMTVNGLPMRVQGFVSTSTPSQLAHWFRQSLGQPLVENKLADKWILGRAKGEHYLTVRLEPAGIGTRGLIAVAHLKAAYDSQSETRAGVDHRQSRLPSGSRVLSQITSEDGGKLYQHLVMINDQSVDLNLEYLKNLMREDGFALQYEISANAGTPFSANPVGTGKALFFKGRGKEAIATIHRKDTGSSIVLNTVMERPK